jgi:hypothetical protein
MYAKPDITFWRRTPVAYTMCVAETSKVQASRMHRCRQGVGGGSKGKKQKQANVSLITELCDTAHTPALKYFKSKERKIIRLALIFTKHLLMQDEPSTDRHIQF